MADTVFVGPSLSAFEVRALLPGAAVRPPVRHGDLLALEPAPGDRVLLVDGLFHQVAPVRHREVLDLLSRGVTVAGSSSMGALRAAELCAFGMRGVGRVFAMYRDGTVTADDEVAVVYGPAEDGYPQLSRPLVDVRHSLDLAVGAGVLPRAEADAVLAAVRALPYRMRVGPAIVRAAGPGPGAQRWLAWARGHPVDLKADDARLLLRLAAAGSPRLAPPGPGDRVPVRLDTAVLRRWRAAHRGERRAGHPVPDAAAVAVVMAWHPDFPAAHRHHVLEGLVGPGPGLARRAADAARARGLTGDDDHLVRLLVHSFGVRRCAARTPDVLPPSLRSAPVLDRARRFARRSAAVNERLPRPDAHRPDRRAVFRPGTIDGVLAAAWDCPPDRLDALARDRGFRGLAALRTAVEPVVGIAVATGEHPFSAGPAPRGGASVGAIRSPADAGARPGPAGSERRTGAAGPAANPRETP